MTAKSKKLEVAYRRNAGAFCWEQDLDKARESERRLINFMEVRPFFMEPSLHDFDLLSRTGVYVWNEGLDDSPRLAHISYESLSQIEDLELGDHEGAIRLLNSIGDVCEETAPLESDVILSPCDVWSEIIRLKLAIWLLETLSSDPRVAREFAEETKLGQEACYRFRQPEHLRLPWVKPVFFSWAGEDAIISTYSALEELVNESLRREQTRYLNFRGDVQSFKWETLSRTPRGAIWEVIAEEAIKRKFPVVCPYCDQVEQRKRVSRKYCKNPACRKAAQRDRERGPKNG